MVRIRANWVATKNLATKLKAESCNTHISYAKQVTNICNVASVKKRLYSNNILRDAERFFRVYVSALTNSSGKKLFVIVFTIHNDNI